MKNRPYERGETDVSWYWGLPQHYLVGWLGATVTSGEGVGLELGVQSFTNLGPGAARPGRPPAPLSSQIRLPTPTQARTAGEIPRANGSWIAGRL